MQRPDLLTLFGRLDASAALAERHLWLADLVDWLRGDEQRPEAVYARLGLLLDAAEARPEVTRALADWWRVLVDTVDASTLLADFGFAPRTAFASELADRLRRRLLPATPDTTDAAELFDLVFAHPFDAEWLGALPAPLLQRLAALLAPQHDRARWRALLVDAITYCVSQVRATGFAPEVRTRMSEAAREQRPFHALSARFDAVRDALARQGAAGDSEVTAAVSGFRAQLDACRHAAASVYTHLDEHGISVGLVFRLRQLRARVLRIRLLLDALLASEASLPAARLLAHLTQVGQARRSVRALVAENSSLLAERVAERSAETGEHYITRNRAEYRDMLRKAAGGGALMSLTTMLKFGVLALGLSAFWGGFLAGLNYAVSFVAIQLLHWTVATKQPAMTAPAMAAKLKELDGDASIEAFVDEVAHLFRSQVAAIIGNLALVAPCVVVLVLVLQALLGKSPVSAHEIAHVWHALTLLGPTLLFAAFTGVLLFASSIIAGWTENAFVLYRLDSALRHNRRLRARLGEARAARWAVWLRLNISGLAANVSLGFMLGLVPAVAGFFGLGLDVRHVTLSTGQIFAAATATGWSALASAPFWLCLAAIPLTGALNVGVSFWCAFRLALRAHNVGEVDRARIRAAIRARLRRDPRSFLWPPREEPHA